ncbi:hypothetical protein WN55_00832 [Dufourea novaeangliae]|uniref:Uncharacterized protein n=1 Tax=Dufourea novaeangliae TaxID=178035 RepID=A0A154PEJ6_DUFNO|nr:hypothetical protein WN55_00832 [Dufourea novaeangliae]
MLTDMEIVENPLIRAPPLLERFPGSFRARNTQKAARRRATIGWLVGLPRF